MANSDKDIDYFALVVAYLPFLVIFLGVFGNLTAFLVFRLNKDLKKISSMVILTFAVVVDTFSLFIWNLDHFYFYYFGIYYEYTSVVLCRIMVFIQYTSLQSSGWLLSLLCIDRYITVMGTPGSFYKKLPFSTPKTACIWSTGVIIFFCALNSHSLMFHAFYDPPMLINVTESLNINGTLINLTAQQWFQSSDAHCGLYTTGFTFYPTWDIAQIYIYSLIPASLMFIFNILVVVKTLSLNTKFKRNPNDQQAIKSFQRKRRITISLISISVAFIVMTLPSTIFWGFYGDASSTNEFHDTGGFLDFISFLNHTSIFWTSYFTNTKFKGTVDNFFKRIFCKNRLGKDINQTQASTISTKATN